jgi:hypothetical protein
MPERQYRGSILEAHRDGTRPGLRRCNCITERGDAQPLRRYLAIFSLDGRQGSTGVATPPLVRDDAGPVTRDACSEQCVTRRSERDGRWIATDVPGALRKQAIEPAAVELAPFRFKRPLRPLIDDEQDDEARPASR